MARIKLVFVYGTLVLTNFIANFLIYNYSFNVQATPYLNEEQRVESSMIMLKTTVPGFLTSSVVFSLVVFLVVNSLLRNSVK